MGAGEMRGCADTKYASTDDEDFRSVDVRRAHFDSYRSALKVQ